MSDDYIKVVPADPKHVPLVSLHQAAIDFLEALFPDGEECSIEVYDELQFIDQGENLEAIICPACDSATDVDFFSENDPGTTFWFATSERLEVESVSDVVVKMPCCGRTTPFTSLRFEWPAAFAKFELSVRNPNVSETLSDIQLSQLEKILGCKLIQVRAHY